MDSETFSVGTAADFAIDPDANPTKTLSQAYTTFKKLLLDACDKDYNQLIASDYSLIALRDNYSFYIGDCCTAQSLTTLLYLGIDIVVNCTDDTKLDNLFESQGIEYTQPLGVSDRPESDEILRQRLIDTKLLEYLFDSIVSGKRVLIHCHAGISRSVTVAICLMMQHFAFNFNEAYDHVQHYRPCIFVKK